MGIMRVRGWWGVGWSKSGGWGCLAGGELGDNELRLSLMKLVFPTFIRKVIFLIFEQLVFLEKIFFK